LICKDYLVKLILVPSKKLILVKKKKKDIKCDYYYFYYHVVKIQISLIAADLINESVMPSWPAFIGYLP